MTQANPLRSTRQRSAIEAVLERAEGFKTAQELHEMLRSDDARVGLTTVYRTLQALSQRGEVDAILSAEGETMYRRCATDDHHHHLVCRTCGTSVEIASDEIEDWAVRAADVHGFTSVTHVAEIYGLCTTCSRA